MTKPFNVPEFKKVSTNNVVIPEPYRSLTRYINKIKSWLISLSKSHLLKITYDFIYNIHYSIERYKSENILWSNLMNFVEKENQFWNNMARLSDEKTIKLRESHFTFPFIKFGYENPDSIDFINWRKLIDENNKFIISNTPIYKINYHPRIQYSPGFARNYNNYVKRK
jgi:hypothetical protein